MNVLIIGSGGREHALASRIARSPRLGKLFCAPGNAGTEKIAENLQLSTDDLGALADSAEHNKIALTVVGPEEPLAAGIVDLFTERGLPIIGPTRLAARIEADKIFAKELMNRALVPTAEARIFDQYKNAYHYIATRDTPLVVKVAGLAKGKGSVLCPEPADALIWIERIMVAKIFGDAGSKIVVEEVLRGHEVSVQALVDGPNIYVLEPARDYKPVGDGDVGRNTGGMGACSSPELVDDKLMAKIQRDILVPIVAAMKQEGSPYRGILYAGLIITPGGPKVLEFNCRFGDPEIQPLLMRLRTDLLEVFAAMLDATLDSITLDWDPRPAVGVVMASGGYPDKYETGFPITGLETAETLPDVAIFHAGTTPTADGIVTSGGRVLCVTALGDSLTDARDRAYDAVERIHFDGAFFRRDIAAPDRAAHRPGTPPTHATP